MVYYHLQVELRIVHHVKLGLNFVQIKQEWHQMPKHPWLPGSVYSRQAQNGVNLDFKFNLTWPWRSGSIIPRNNRDLNQGLLHLWSRFGDSSLNGWWVVAWTSWWLTDTKTHIQTHTHTGNDNTRRSKLASGKKWRHPLLWQIIGEKDSGSV